MLRSPLAPARAIVPVAALLFLAGLTPALAQTYRDVQAGRVASLPHEMTPEEELIKGEIGRDFRQTPPPSAQPVRNLAETERQEGVLIRYPLGISVAVVAEMAQNTIVYCVVTTSQQSAANTAFQNGGVNMSNVVWVNGASDSYWTRDYGPWFIYDANEDLSIIDTIYNRPRPNDDAVPQLMATRLGLPLYGPNLITAGGNYMTDGRGIAISTDLVWDENPSQTHAQINQTVHDYLGIETYHVVPDVNGEYIRHIDCWGKFLAVDKILIRQVPASDSQYDEIEAAVDYFENRPSAYGWPYEVVRVYTPNDEPYTNSLILNEKVLVPVTGGAWDDEALAAYQAAMPGYQVLGFTGSWESTDALHCRAMGIGDRRYVYVFSRPLQDTGNSQDPYRVAAEIIDYSQVGLNANELRVYWRPGVSGSFNNQLMTSIAGTDSFFADIPTQPNGTTVQYYVHAADVAGRQDNWPLVGAAGPFQFQIIAPITLTTLDYPDTEDTVGPYYVESTVTASYPLDDVELYYRVNGGAFSGPVGMGPIGGNVYRGAIPGQAYTSLVEYYVRATDTNANEVFDPPSAPATLFTFYVAPRLELFAADMEGGSSWTHAPVTSGWTDQWHLSTQRNHTSGGATSWKCGDAGAGAYANHQDAGLLTSAFDLALSSHLSFWQYVSAETSAVYAGRAYDGGLVELYADGRWQQIAPIGGYPFSTRGTSGPFAEGTGVFSGQRNWQVVEFDLTGYEGAAQLRWRFGTDAGTGREGWYVDDVMVDGLILDLQAIDAPAPSDLARLSVSPNPMRSEANIRFTLDQPSPARLAIFDAQGRLVRMLVDGELQPGSHALAWDRTDRAGREVAPGVYFYRLDASGTGTTQRMVVVR